MSKLLEDLPNIVLFAYGMAEADEGSQYDYFALGV